MFLRRRILRPRMGGVDADVSSLKGAGKGLRRLRGRHGIWAPDAPVALELQITDFISKKVIL